MNVLAMMEAAKGNSFIHRLNPMAKLFWCLCMIAIPIITVNPYATIPIIVIIWILGLAAGLWKIFITSVLKTYAAMLSFIIIIWPLFYGKGDHVVIKWGILFITWEGIAYAFAQGFRIATAVTGCLYLVMVTEIIDISSAMGIILQKFHISYTGPLMVTSAFKFLPEFMGDFSTIKEAFLTRGFELDKGGFVQKIKNYVPLFVPLMDSSLDKANNIATVMQLRAFGYTKRRTYYMQYKFGAGEILFMALGAACVVFAKWANTVCWEVLICKRPGLFQNPVC
jgi:energy-coupling factor transport system permease protein